MSVSVNAQKAKLGLVLSGGGAKGLAHIGLLKAMEKSGLRPDYITGTSMGAIIGGLYALGYSADDLEKIMLGIDWDEVLSNNIPLNYIAYEEKEYYSRFLIELSLAAGKLQIPGGVIEGQILGEVLNHYTWPALQYKNYDEFPIPFRCIATDVSNGSQIVFSSGSLSEAMRASMAIPTLFTPADLDSTQGVDGGIVNNFPADVLKEMGADIIIGVNVTRGYKKSEDINSFSGIMMQLTMISSNNKLPELKSLCDVYFELDLDQYTAGSFSSHEEILEIGNQAGLAAAPQLDSLSRILGRKEQNDGMTKPYKAIVIDTVSLTGNNLFSNELIMGKLGISAGDSVGPDDLQESVNSVYGINGFYKVEYSLSNTSSEKMALNLKMREKPPVALRAAFHYDNTFSAGILLNMQVRDFFLKSSRTIFAVDISENPRFRVDYYKYAGIKQRVALNVRYDYIRDQLPIYENGYKKDVQFNTENLISFNVLTTKSLRNSYLIGASYRHEKFSSEFYGIFPTGLEFGQVEYGDIYASYTRNSLNNRNYPVKGTERLFLIDATVKSNFKVKYYGSIDSLLFTDSGIVPDPVYLTESALNDVLHDKTPSVYGQFYLRTVDYFFVNKYFQVIPVAALNLNFSYDSVGTMFKKHHFGGNQKVKFTDTRFFGLNYAEYDVLNFVTAGLYMQNVVLRNFFIKYGANAMAYYDHIPLGNPQNFDFNYMAENQFMVGYGGQITYRSFIGPVSFGVSSNTFDKFIRYYFSIGYSFNYAD